MSAGCPHYLLFSQTTGGCAGRLDRRPHRWRFVLEAVEGDTRVVAEDVEPDLKTTRLELLAVVRGLEALDGPSRVTLITGSRYVSRGIRRGLSEWRRHNWRWERFGRWVPIRDHDLWRRVDRALQFHRIDCRTWRLDDRASSDDADQTRTNAETVVPEVTVHSPGELKPTTEEPTTSDGRCGRSGERPRWLDRTGRRISAAGAGATGMANRPQLAAG